MHNSYMLMLLKGRKWGRVLLENDTDKHVVF